MIEPGSLEADRLPKRPGAFSCVDGMIVVAAGGGIQV